MSELPSGWVEATVGDVTGYVSRGKSPKYAESSSLPVVNQRAIRWFGIQQEHLKFVHPDQFPQWTEERFIRDGDILWNSTGTGTIGRACLVTTGDLFPPKVVDSHVTILRPQRDAIEPRYLFAWIRGPEVQHSIEDLATGTTNQIELNRATIMRTRVPLAPLAEQRRVADKIDALLTRVDACRDRLDRVPTILRRLRQSILASAASGELSREWREANGSQDDWPVVTLRDVCSSIADGDHQAPPKSDSGVPFITIGAINTGLLKLDNATRFVSETYHRSLKPERSPQFGDVLVSVTGSIGIAALVDTHEPFVFQRHIAVLRPNARVITSEYLFHRLSADDMRQQGQSVATGTAQLTIPLKALRSFTFSLPPLVEQLEIARRVGVLLAFVDNLESHFRDAINRVEALTPSALAKAFRGELVPQDPGDEPASALLARNRSHEAVGIARKSKRGDTRRPSTKTRAETDMLTRKDVTPTHLSSILKERGALAADVLWGASQLEIDEFYAQLKDEEEQGLLRENRGESIGAPRLLESAA